MTEDCQRSNTEGLSCRAARHVFDPQDEVNVDLLAFIKGEQRSASA